MSSVAKPRSTRVRLTPSLSAGVGGLGLILLGATLLAVVALVRGMQPLGSAETPYSVNEQVSAHSMSATAVADKVLERLTSMGTPASAAKVLSMTVTTGAKAADFEASAGRPGVDSPDANAVVWLVRAEGTFVGLRVPPGTKPITSATGYFIVDDASGEVVEMGMP